MNYVKFVRVGQRDIHDICKFLKRYEAGKRTIDSNIPQIVFEDYIYRLDDEE